jgi:hypothetical protein
MKISLLFEINSDIYEDLIEDFEVVTYKEVAKNEDKEECYEQVEVDTLDLKYKNFEDWLEPWLLNHELKQID